MMIIAVFTLFAATAVGLHSSSTPSLSCRAARCTQPTTTLQARAASLELHSRYCSRSDEATSTISSTSDFQEMCGPVTIKWAGEKGRGLFAQADIRKGDVLLVEKAFGYGFATDAYSSIDVLVLTLYEKIMQSDHHNFLLSFLCDGIREMVLPSMYDIKATTASSAAASAANKLSIENIQGIVRMNSFDFFNNPIPGSTSATAAKYYDKKDGTALWLLTSFLNHSRKPNTFRKQFGDIKVITASKDIEKGTELTTMYHYNPGALKQWGIDKNSKE